MKMQNAWRFLRAMKIDVKLVWMCVCMEHGTICQVGARVIEFNEPYSVLPLLIFILMEP